MPTSLDESLVIIDRWIMMLPMKTIIRSLLLLPLSFLLLTQCNSAAEVSAGGSQVDAFWGVSSAQEQASAAKSLRAAAPDVATLYEWLQVGPAYSDDVPRGELSQSRISDDGMEFPYVLLVPDSYSPRKPYPVEFNLHGGVNRPKNAEGEPVWRNGYDSIRDPNRIVVVPASWNESYWWFDNQADNLPAILNIVKQTYNVDENRVYLTGVSDGGTGTYFFAFLQPTEWAAYLPFIGTPSVLQNPRGRVSYGLAFENLKGKPLYIVNGEIDRLYPARSVQKHIDAMKQYDVDYTFTVIEGGGHDTRWLPEKKAEIEAFKNKNSRDPLPDTVQWTTSQTDRYNRNHWLIVDTLATEGEPGRVIVKRQGNTFDVESLYVQEFTLLLSPKEIDFSLPVIVKINGKTVHDGIVEQSAGTLLKWATRDHDRTMLFTAELTLQLPQ